MGVWIERSATVDVEAGRDELFVYYSNLETLSDWCVSITFLSFCTGGKIAKPYFPPLSLLADGTI